ncbi:MAG: phosphoribosylamine--glycine ligase [Planctomycetaceae bacterium]|nr:phosphoribosylamine--glycine ligase [Planctomycetaceae bacterium]
MKVLVIGQGGREHVLVWKLAQSPKVEKVYCAPGNAGTALDAENVAIADTDIPGLLEFARSNEIDLTVVGPEAPLVAGLSDAFREAGLKVFGPSQAAAQLEGSKEFSKQIMRAAKVPTADYRVFTHADEALEYIDLREQEAVVVKADGLAAGKGVFVCSTKDEAKDAVKTIMVDHKFKEAGAKVVIEDCLEGIETSILAIVDGKTIIPLETSQDHKRAHDGDTGPNTGGMGAYSPAPYVDDDMMDTIIEKILIPTVHTMKTNDTDFSGVLYAGLMLTSQGPKVLEFNVRFGDPEAQPVLMRLKSDLFEILMAAAEGRLDQIDDLEWDERAAICVVMAADGYPGSYPKGDAITGIDDANELENVKVFHAGTKLVDGKVLTNGGRVLGVTALADNLTAAKLQAYKAVKAIRWSGAWCRKDISDKARD